MKNASSPKHSRLEKLAYEEFQRFHTSIKMKKFREAHVEGSFHSRVAMITMRAREAHVGARQTCLHTTNLHEP